MGQNLLAQQKNERKPDLEVEQEPLGAAAVV